MNKDEFRRMVDALKECVEVSGEDPGLAKKLKKILATKSEKGVVKISNDNSSGIEASVEADPNDYKTPWEEIAQEFYPAEFSRLLKKEHKIICYTGSTCSHPNAVRFDIYYLMDPEGQISVEVFREGTEQRIDLGIEEKIRTEFTKRVYDENIKPLGTGGYDKILNLVIEYTSQEIEKGRSRLPSIIKRVFSLQKKLSDIKDSLRNPE